MALAIPCVLPHDGRILLSNAPRRQVQCESIGSPCRTLRNSKRKPSSFHRQFTLLVGDNGSGKTAVLDALRIGVGAYLLGIPHSRAPSIKTRVCATRNPPNRRILHFRSDYTMRGRLRRAGASLGPPLESGVGVAEWSNESRRGLGPLTQCAFQTLSRKTTRKRASL